jgi:hypothetical protein
LEKGEESESEGFEDEGAVQEVDEVGSKGEKREEERDSEAEEDGQQYRQ